MRGDLPSYELRPARRLDEVLALLAAEPGVWRPLAGGTDVMVLLASGKLAHKKFIDLWSLAELRGIEETAAALTFGALTTYSDVQAHATTRREFPMLCLAAGETGGWAIQNRGTLGGNIANASPAADSPPALLAYGAEVELASVAGRRWVPYAEFHTGYKQTVQRDGELITRVRVPRVAATGGAGDRVHCYRKVGPRRAQAISKVCFAGCADRDERQRVTACRIAVGGVAPIVVRCPETERAVIARDAEGARAALAREIAPIDDVRSTARYRRRVAGNLLDQFLLLLR